MDPALAPASPSHAHNATALALASQTHAWKSGYHYRSLVLAPVLKDDVPALCSASGDVCYLVVLSDGQFRYRSNLRKAKRLHAGLKETLPTRAFKTMCLFPSRRFARGSFGRSNICDETLWPGKNGKDATDMGQDVAHLIESISCIV